MDYRGILESTVGIPFSSGNAVRVLKNGQEIFPAMLDAIRDTRHQIDFLTFVYWKGDIAERFARLLGKKAREGVGVRVILDCFGAAFMPRELVEHMEKCGVEVEWIRPLKRWKIWKSDNRTHRKILICDGNIAFTGGVGIAEEWEGDARNPSEWRETHFRVEGLAVRGLQAAFLENWIETGHPLHEGLPWHRDDGQTQLSDERSIKDIPLQVVRTSASVFWSDIVILYRTLVRMAQESIRIATAYFNPNASMVTLLCEAARRGVEVHIMMPGKHIDKRVANIAGGDRFQTLLDAGVNLWFYQKTMLHAKVILVDHCVCCIGSANFNHRSMLKDDEINLVALSSELAALLDNHFEEDLICCEEIKQDRWEQRSLMQRGLEVASKIFKQQI